MNLHPIDLNDYQVQFLRGFAREGVRFLVIGGQARRLYHGGTTRDLDIWVDISSQNLAPLERALVAWSEEHPAHRARPLSAPLDLRPNVLVKFPDTDGCCYLDQHGEPVEIGHADGVDVLTSLKARDFAADHANSVSVTIDGTEVRFLSEDAMLATAKPMPLTGPIPEDIGP